MKNVSIPTVRDDVPFVIQFEEDGTLTNVELYIQNLNKDRQWEGELGVSD